MINLINANKNIFANYVSLLYTTLMGLLILPLYMTYLGEESYGLVGFYTLIYTLFHVIDMGVVSATSRQISYIRSGKKSSKNILKLLRSFEFIFLILSITAILLIFLSSNWIAKEWINTQHLEKQIVSTSISMMGVVIGLKWFSSLYRGGINGLEDQVWLSSFNIIITSIRFIGALGLMYFFSISIVQYFLYQIVVGLLEVVIFSLRFYKKTSLKIFKGGLFFDKSTMRSLAPFVLMSTYTSGIWIIITQVDKLILSTTLSLVEFGYFSLIVLMASMPIVITFPIVQAVLPRMTSLLSNGDKKSMVVLYRNSSQISTVIAISITFSIVIFPEAVLYAWTGNASLASWGDETLFWFMLGNGVLAINGFQYYIQNIHGDLKIHTISSTLSLMVRIPIMYYCAINYGAEGVGIAWFCINLIWFLLWPPIVHNRLLPGMHFDWIFKDILPIIIGIFFMSILLRFLVDVQPYASSLFSIFFLISICSIFIFITGLLSSRYARGKIFSFILNAFND